jgi:hypothetical protein
VRRRAAASQTNRSACPGWRWGRTGDKGEGKGGKLDKMTGMIMSKDGREKGDGKGGGKKRVIAPIDSSAMWGQQAGSRGQMNRVMDRSNMDCGMQRGMERKVDGINR